VLVDISIDVSAPIEDSRAKSDVGAADAIRPLAIERADGAPAVGSKLRGVSNSVSVIVRHLPAAHCGG
jgi:hypothetical protein